MKVLKCEICGEKLARFNPRNVKRPINGGMFEPLMSDREYPMPWPSPAELIDWEMMRCPYCHKRPIIQERQIMTPEGHVYVPAGKGAPKRKTK